MLPLKLSIEGLYSYQKKQTIDFTALTEAGLFGIFGSVGSGKSSVLEAIGFVLYAETERLNSRDKRTYNMLNLKSNQASIDFEFLNYEDRKFKFTASWNRKKKFDETTSLARSAYEWIGQEWIPLPSADATAIIGLSYDNFRRTIIIPQGKFKEFLDLGGTDRSNMMKEIFHLQKFDLSTKVTALQVSNKSSIDELKGALSGFESVSQENIVVKETATADAKELLITKTTLLTNLTTEFEILKTLKTNFEELEKRKIKLSELNAVKPKMDALQAEITEFEKVEKVFGAILLKLNQSNAALEIAKADYSKTEHSCKTIQETITSIENALLVLQPQFDNLGVSRNTVLDLESIAKILKLKVQRETIEAEIAKENNLIIALSAQEQEEKKKLGTFQNEILELKSKRTDTSIVLAVGQWFLINNAFQKSIEDLNANSSSTSNKITAAQASFETLGLSCTSWATDLKAKSDSLETTKKELEASKNKLLVAKGLAQFAHNLHDGENCPLCGALEHPNPMQVVDVSKEIEAIALSILEVDNQEKGIKNTVTNAEKINLEVSLLEGQLVQFQNAKAQAEKDQKSHLQTFIWKEFSPTDFAAFENQQLAQQQLELNIKTAENNEIASRKVLENSAADLKTHTANQSKIQSNKAAVTGAITNELSQLRVLSFEEYENKEVTSIQSEKTNLEAANSRIASDYDSKLAELVQRKNEASQLKGSLITQKGIVESNEKVSKETNEEVQNLLVLNQLETIESVQLLLSKSWDINSEKETIQQFAINLETAKNGVAESEKLIAGQQFDSAIYETKEKEALAAKEVVENQIGIVAALKSELDKMREELKQKSDLLTKFAALESRAANLTTLTNMFKGSGFVNYVSSIYLQNLADVANVRFHRMTKNQLSLQINSSNEFEVIDYLNNGASRSVKTLSGGQGFQASLSLALALAESVQSLNKNNKNFFFIDEGFGTQDPESVAVVFETLQSLYKENRIVGIISHVTELQERIPRSITVVKDEDKGSEILENWN